MSSLIYITTSHWAPDTRLDGDCYINVADLISYANFIIFYTNIYLSTQSYIIKVRQINSSYPKPIFHPLLLKRENEYKCIIHPLFDEIK